MNLQEDLHSIFLKIVSAVCMTMAFIMSFAITYQIIINPGFELEINNLYFIAFLFIIGLIGTVLKDYTSRLIDRNLTNFLRTKEGSKIVSEVVSTAINKNKLEYENIFANPIFYSYVKQALQEKSFEKNIVKEKEGYEFNTVIVPARWSWEWNIIKKTYFCQKGRKFRGVPYIAFYADRQIRFVAKKRQMKTDEIIEFLSEEDNREYIMANSGTTDLDFYSLETGSIPNDGKLYIKHEDPYALVMNQIYTTYKSLTKAQFTLNIDREKVRQ